MATNFRNIQLGQIHKLAKALGMDSNDKDPSSTYRQSLKSIIGKTSSAKMNVAERALVIKRFTEMGAAAPKKPVKKYKHATSRKLVMLWADIRHQGKLRTSETRLEDWLKSQYEKPNPDWLSEKERDNAIGRLKSWKKRLITPRKR